MLALRTFFNSNKPTVKIGAAENKQISLKKRRYKLTKKLKILPLKRLTKHIWHFRLSFLI